MTKIVAHRGANKYAPENTFAAADLALEQGADYIELDVRESADGVLYVHHDETLDRTTNARGPIGEALSSEIDALDAGRWYSTRFAGQRVPRLDAYLRHLKGRCGVYLELKHCDPAKVAVLVRSLGIQRETFYFSFSAQMRDGLQRLAPELRKMITLTMAGSPALAGPLHAASILEISVDQMWRQPHLLATARDLGLAVMVYYGGQDPEVFAKIAACAPDYINTDNTELFVAARAKHGA
ncbi:glycerophosphodiester phosphodiesterase family protein [Rhodobacteraceae bacterium]|nr:glycerophosphodiester phosphodiesterase family protein [Paracoccaceae bacterium]